MLLNTVLIDTVSQIKKMKAPRNMMWKVDSINFSNITSVTGEVLVYDREIGQAITQVQGTESNVIASINSTTVQEHQITGIDHTTKYLTIATSSGSGSPNTKVMIYGEIIKATIKELLIEWFRKR